MFVLLIDVFVYEISEMNLIEPSRGKETSAF